MPFDVETSDAGERDEQLGLLLRREARAVILHPKPHYIVGLIGAQLQNGRVPAVFDAVAQVVDPHLLDPGGVADGGGPFGGQRDLGVALLNFITQARLGCHNNFFHIKHFGSDLIFAHVGQQEQFVDDAIHFSRRYFDFSQE